MPPLRRILLMRRLAVVVGVVGMMALGFGAAFVLAGSRQGTPGSGEVPICHSGNGKQFVYETPDASGVLSGHADHQYDIIPPFEVIETGGATTHYPGKNLDTMYEGGYTGAEIHANRCVIPSGGGGITETTTTTETGTVPVTVTEPATTVTSPGATTTTVLTVTETAPAQTVTVPGTTTAVTVPSGARTTVALPPQTVTLPGVTTTIPGGTVERDPVTIRLQGTTRTITAGATTTVVTVTGRPSSGVEGAVAESKRVTVTLTTPSRRVR